MPYNFRLPTLAANYQHVNKLARLAQQALRHVAESRVLCNRNPTGLCSAGLGIGRYCHQKQKWCNDA